MRLDGPEDPGAEEVIDKVSGYEKRSFPPVDTTSTVDSLSGSIRSGKES